MSQPDFICETPGSAITVTSEANDHLTDRNHHNDNFSNLVTTTYTQYGILVRNDPFEDAGDSTAHLSIFQPDINDIAEVLERHKHLTKDYDNYQGHLTNTDNNEDTTEVNDREDMSLKSPECHGLAMHAIDDGKICLIYIAFNYKFVIEKKCTTKWYTILLSINFVSSVSEYLLCV